MEKITHIAYLIIIALLLATLPYAKRGYDQTVIEKYAQSYTANMGDLK
jgi:hypothetical protein